MKPSSKILVIGSSNTDMTVKSPTIPRPGETVVGGEFKMGAGGKGANQAVAAKRLGGDVTFVCKVGNDIFGDNAVESYMKEGMDVSHVLRSDKPSGVALILVDGNGKKTVYELDDLDPRYWFAGSDIAVDKHITLPADASGQCTLYLNLPDPKETLHDNPRFSIRLANDNVWDSKTGYNKIAEFTL